MCSISNEFLNKYNVSGILKSGGPTPPPAKKSIFSFHRLLFRRFSSVAAHGHVNVHAERHNSAENDQKIIAEAAAHRQGYGRHQLGTEYRSENPHVDKLVEAEAARGREHVGGNRNDCLPADRRNKMRPPKIKTQIYKQL